MPTPELHPASIPPYWAGACGLPRPHWMFGVPVPAQCHWAAATEMTRGVWLRPPGAGARRPRPALTMLPYRRVYCAMITPLVVVTLLVSSNSVSGAGPSNSRAPLPKVSGQISSV